ncbi:MAG: glycosyltransferase family 4 protein [Chthoniobacterales bacterium]
MDSTQLKISFVRRGFSGSGGAEAYLKRLAEGAVAAGHEATLISTDDWPPNEWLAGPFVRLPGKSPRQFADAVETQRAAFGCDVLMSLERVWRCDVYRAGDGVHRAWLDRRARLGGAWEKIALALNHKHRAILELERALFADNGARRVIANSEMVKREIIDVYGYPAERIAVVPNGVPVKEFQLSAEDRTASRAELGIMPDEIAVLFVGSGWERKGLRFAIDAVETCGLSGMRLLVAGRGNEPKYRSPFARFLGVVRDLPRLYAAANIFLLPTIYDPFSNACLEALAAGVPVITTRANGFSEIIEDGTHGSIVHDPNDVAALARALKFWSSAEARAEAQKQNRKLAAGYDISVNVARTLEILLAR